jgi:hypothetical protein
MHPGADETQPSRHILKVGIPCPTTGTRKEWAAPGATTIPTTFKPHTTGATMKKDQQEWMADGRLSGQEKQYSPTCQVFNDLPRLCFLGVSQKVS